MICGYWRWWCVDKLLLEVTTRFGHMEDSASNFAAKIFQRNWRKSLFGLRAVISLRSNLNIPVYQAVAACVMCIAYTVVIGTHPRLKHALKYCVYSSLDSADSTADTRNWFVQHNRVNSAQCHTISSAIAISALCLSSVTLLFIDRWYISRPTVGINNSRRISRTASFFFYF